MPKQKGALPEYKALGTVLTALVHLDAKKRAWVLTSVATNLEITTLNLSGTTPPAGAAPLAAAAAAASAIPGGPGTNAHAKAFLRAKNPTTVVQRIACLAYYLTHFKNTPQFKTRAITKMNSDAAGTSITNPSQSVADATRHSKYLASAGAGKKQLTGFGEAVVNALPDQTAVSALEKAEPARKKRRRPPDLDAR